MGFIADRTVPAISFRSSFSSEALIRARSWVPAAGAARTSPYWRWNSSYSGVPGLISAPPVFFSSSFTMPCLASSAILAAASRIDRLFAIRSRSVPDPKSHGCMTVFVTSPCFTITMRPSRFRSAVES